MPWFHTLAEYLLNMPIVASAALSP
jgi:hypothetical protein